VDERGVAGGGRIERPQALHYAPAPHDEQAGGKLGQQSPGEGGPIGTLEQGAAELHDA
jgi:hypothetical protein